MRARVLALGLAAVIPAAGRAQNARGAMGLAWQLTHSANYDPSFAPDGKRMVYISVLAGREQLFIAGVDGRGAVQLTHDDADHEDPAWSPDGARIAFVQVKDGREVVSVMNADGSGVEALSPAAARAIHPSWSPDGLRLAYCDDDDVAPPRKNAADIHVIELRTHRISTPISGGINTYPVWSPDGKRIAFRRMLGEMNSEVFVANADGSDPRNLTNHPAFDGWPAWSPDGSRIAFASNRNANYQVFVMRSDGSDVRLLANTEGRATAPQWTRDGARIYFSICRKVDYGGDCQIFAADAGGSGPPS